MKQNQVNAKHASVLRGGSLPEATFPLFVEVDEIYNLACPASPVHYQHDPVQTTKTSVHGAITIYGEGVRGRENIPHWRRHAPEGTECRRLET